MALVCGNKLLDSVPKLLIRYDNAASVLLFCALHPYEYLLLPGHLQHAGDIAYSGSPSFNNCKAPIKMRRFPAFKSAAPPSPLPQLPTELAYSIYRKRRRNPTRTAHGTSDVNLLPPHDLSLNHADQHRDYYSVFV